MRINQLPEPGFTPEPYQPKEKHMNHIMKYIWILGLLTLCGTLWGIDTYFPITGVYRVMQLVFVGICVAGVTCLIIALHQSYQIYKMRRNTTQNIRERGSRTISLERSQERSQTKTQPISYRDNDNPQK